MINLIIGFIVENDNVKAYIVDEKDVPIDYHDNPYYCEMGDEIIYLELL